MTFLVVLVVDLICISFANKIFSVTKQFGPFTPRNFGITFPRRGKILVLFIPEVSANSVTFASPQPFISNTSLAPSSTAIKHDLGYDSHINRPFWQSNNKRPHCFAISVLFSHLSSSNKNPMRILINNSLPSVYLNIRSYNRQRK